MARPGRPPKQVISRNSSQEISDGENSGDNSGDNSGMNLLEAPPTPLRPSILSGSASAHRSGYVAPQWLLEKKTAKFFSVPIPGVPQEIQDAVEQRLLNSGDLMHKREARKSHKLLAQIKHWQDQLAVCKREVQEQEEMLAKANSTKESKLEEIRAQKLAEMESKLTKLEDKLKQERDVKLKEAEEATRQKLLEEFEVTFEKKEEESRKRKRKEEDEQAAKESGGNQEEGEEGEEGEETAGEGSDEPDSKRTKTDNEIEEGEEEEDGNAEKLESELIQDKIDALNAKVESLTEMKSEMVWLMKQVIKAEMKRKLKKPKQAEDNIKKEPTS